MNIFILSLLIRECVEFMVDSHIVKMPLETIQLLYSAHHWSAAQTAFMEANAPLVKDGSRRGYRLTHSKHPCSLWLRESPANYRWLVDYGRALCGEYEYRFERTHDAARHLQWLGKNPPPYSAELRGLDKTEHKQCVPQWIKDLRLSVVDAYRVAYIHEKQGKIKMFAWRKRARPAWMDEPRLLGFTPPPAPTPPPETQRKKSKRLSKKEQAPAAKRPRTSGKSKEITKPEQQPQPQPQVAASPEKQVARRPRGSAKTKSITQERGEEPATPLSEQKPPTPARKRRPSASAAGKSPKRARKALKTTEGRAVTRSAAKKAALHNVE
eukprot:gnl/Spiro4/8767_TR4602_c0_g1_i1.p1 gnl/Spiro4/8767_TR4602_c0_g1~~gnl/Spiro4/8767_TR4602_c0_g1_i1.p1  ORF type:complete len:344 (-),score=120.29 gnl/Spiro4/8767_TR4602_c0_g1_i1:113-1087(-)